MQLCLPLSFLLLNHGQDILLKIDLTLIQLRGILQRHVDMDTLMILAISHSFGFVVCSILHLENYKLSVNLGDLIGGHFLNISDTPLNRTYGFIFGFYIIFNTREILLYNLALICCLLRLAS